MPSHQQFYGKISFPKNFEDTYNLFLEMIKVDDAVKDFVLPGNEGRGIFSSAIRMLINNYVEDGREEFLKGKRNKIKKDED